MATLQFTNGVRKVTFSGATTTITTAFAGQQAEMELKARGQIAAYVDYTSGNETTIDLQVEMSPDVDYPVTNPATGTDYYIASTVDATSNVFGTVFVFNSAGKFRLPLPLLHQERMLRISIKRTGGTDVGSGSVSIRVVDDSHPVTSAIAGKQP